MPQPARSPPNRSAALRSQKASLERELALIQQALDEVNADLAAL